MLGKMKDLFKEIIYNVISPPEIFDERAKEGIDMIEKDKNLLEWVSVSRNDVDMDLLKEIYNKINNTDLKTDVENVTTGSYKLLITGLIGIK